MVRKPGAGRPHGSRSARDDSRPRIHRLTLNVSNRCNLACRYCYAAHGVYYGLETPMNRDTALQAINYVTRNFSAVDHVNFFGGEPSMNPEVIATVCDYFRFLVSRGVIRLPPRFGVTTNGYDAEGVLRLVQRYGLSVCVSLDGPEEIHDRLRPARTGTGTHATVVRFVRALIEAGIQPEFECTYTAEHLQMGISVKRLMEYFHGEFGCRTLHCPVVAATPRSPYYVPDDAIRTLYCEAIDASVRNLAADIPMAVSIAARLLRHLSIARPISHYCPAGRDSLTIDTNGRVFACFMLMNDPGFAVGSVQDASGVRVPASLRRLLRSSDKGRHVACRSCWARSLCFGCLGEDLARRGESPARSSFPGRSPLCDLKRSLIDCLLGAVREVATFSRRS